MLLGLACAGGRGEEGLAPGGVAVRCRPLVPPLPVFPGRVVHGVLPCWIFGLCGAAGAPAVRGGVLERVRVGVGGCRVVVEVPAVAEAVVCVALRGVREEGVCGDDQAVPLEHFLAGAGAGAGGVGGVVWVAITVWMVELDEVVEALLRVGFVSSLTEDLIWRGVFLMCREFGPEERWIGWLRL